jgi:hypothetical protein
LSSAMLLPMATNAAFEILQASPAAIRLGEGDCSSTRRGYPSTKGRCFTAEVL